MTDTAKVTKPKSTLRASASTFVPSFLKPTAKAFVPASSVKPVYQAEVVKPVEAAPVPAPVTAPVTAPVATPVPTPVQAPTTPVKAASVPDAPVTPVKQEPEAEIQPKSCASPASTESTTSVSEKESEDVVVPASPGRKRRISYTIAEMLAMEPELCPVPQALVGCIVLAVPGESKIARAMAKQAKEDKPHKNRDHHDRPKKSRKNKKHHQQPAEEDLSNVKPFTINEETRWKPKAARENKEETTTEEHLHAIQAILNKLSVEKFERLSDQLITVAVNSLDVLKGAIDMVVKKAQMEWHFSAMYAELCTKMARTEMPLVVSEDEAGTLKCAAMVVFILNELDGERNTAKLFRTLLLTRCQKEFEVTPLTSLNEADTNGLSADELAEKALILKRATLGHIRFIGELYKQGMLSSRIMHECIQRLFGNIEAPDEESLECLCKLISTVGARLEERALAVPVEKTLMDQYFDLVAKLAKANDKLCTRVRFMLQDLLDLRANKYVSRIKEVKATTIAEVHAQVAREERSKASGTPNKRTLTKSQSMAIPPVPSAPRRSSSSLSNASNDPDGWETIPSKPKMTKSISVPDNKRLNKNGPPPSGRERGDRSDRATRSRESRRGSVERPPRNPVSKGGFHRSASLAALPSAAAPLSAPEPVVEPVPVRSEDDITKKAKSMLKEFAHENDIKEVVASLPDALSHSEAIATTVFNYGLEHSQQERSAVGPFLVGLAAAKLLETSAVIRSIADILEFLEDLEIDIPLAGKYMGEMVAPLVAHNVIELKSLDTPMATLSEDKQKKLKHHLAAAITALKVEALHADVQAFTQAYSS